MPIPMPDGSGHLCYQRLGHGPTALLAFHGFGQDGRLFAEFDPMLGGAFTVYAVDLFFHGQSDLAPDRLLAKSDWWSLVDGLLDQERIGRFSVLGFSLGGRFALTTVEAFAARIDHVYLAAPDGITRSLWHELATNSRFGRWFFSWFLTKLPVWNRLGDGLARIGLLHRTRLRFVEGSLATPAQRTQLYQTWVNFRRIRPDLDLISRLLSNLPVRVQCFVGQQDRIVPPAYANPLLRRLKNAELITFAVGHTRLMERVAGSLI